MHFDAIELENVFENGEIDHLFLNFSDNDLYVLQALR